MIELFKRNNSLQQMFAGKTAQLKNSILTTEEIKGRNTFYCSKCQI